MKPQFVSARVLKAGSILATAVLLIVSNPTNSHATPIKDKKIAQVTEEQVTVQYAGSDNNNFVFRVQFENPSAQKFSLLVKNDEGVVVYQEQFNDAHFVRTVRLEKGETEIHPTFVIRTANGEVKRSFLVNTTITENVVVTKL